MSNLKNRPWNQKNWPYFGFKLFDQEYDIFVSWHAFFCDSHAQKGGVNWPNPKMPNGPHFPDLKLWNQNMATLLLVLNGEKIVLFSTNKSAITKKTAC